MAMTLAASPGLWTRFSARFDRVLLAPPNAAAEPDPALAPASELAQALAALCQTDLPFALAVQTLAGVADQRAAQQAWLQRHMLHLDGTLHMQQQGGPWRQRLHRLAIKLGEAFAGPAAAGPWDCGWLNSGPAALAQASRFRPRRPTLMVAWQLERATLDALQAALQQGQERYHLPVRLWVLGTAHPQA